MARPSPSTRPKSLLGLASLAVALAAADTYVVVLALTDMMAGVGVSIDALQRATPIISGFLLGYIAALPLIGRVADLTSRHRVLQACLAIFVVGSVITALASDLPVLVAGRVIQGLGGGGLVPATLALVADLWPPDRRGTPLGVVGAVQELGSVIGPVLGAMVLSVWSWHAIFWLNAAAGVVLAVGIAVLTRHERPTGPSASWWVWSLVGVALALLVLALWAPDSLVQSVRWGVPFVPFAWSTSTLATPVGVAALGILGIGVAALAWSSRDLIARVDLIGASLIGVALGAIVLTFATSQPETEVIGPWGWSLLPAAGLSLLAYAWRHRVAADPLIPAGVLRGRVPWALLVSALTGVALVAIVVDVPIFARLAYTDSQTTAALVLVRFLVAVPVGAVVGGAALRHLGDGLVAGLGLGLTAVALVTMATWERGSLSGLAATASLIAAGLGIGLALAPVNNAVLADSPPTGHGSASALVVVARMTGMVVGLALLTAVGLHRYYLSVGELTTTPSTDELVDAGIAQVHAVFTGAALAAALGALAALALRLAPRTAKSQQAARIRA